MGASVEMSRDVASVEQARPTGGHWFWDTVVRERSKIDGPWGEYDRRLRSWDLR
jgi:hypothetical protein